MRRKHRNPAQRLRSTVDSLPERTRHAMLRGIDTNRIIVGAYTDPTSGGICPMLAAHRNGGRTDLASFAVAWDAFTDARRPRLATRREIRTLRSYLEMSLLADDHRGESLTKLAADIRADRTAIASRNAAAPTPATPNEIRIHRHDTPDRSGAADVRDRLRWALTRPERRYDRFRDLLAVAEEQLAEQRAAELLGPQESASSPATPAEPAR